MFRRFIPWLVTLAALLVAGAVLARPFVVHVPYPASNLGATRAQLESLGLRASAMRKDGSGSPLDADRVVEQRPAPRTRYLKGMHVELQTEPPTDDVAMPDLVGRFGADARLVLAQAGLVAAAARDIEVVVSQEPSAGVVVPYGTRVSYRAVFAHNPNGTSAEVKAVHGVMYLRYGVDRTPACDPCHSADTCFGAPCHTTKAFEQLEKPLDR